MAPPRRSVRGFLVDPPIVAGMAGISFGISHYYYIWVESPYPKDRNKELWRAVVAVTSNNKNTSHIQGSF